MPAVAVLDSTMAYLEAGSGTPIVFLHGNPTSSHLWRNVLPGIGGPGRLLAPDLVGMGASGKPAIDYSFADHARYLDAWFDGVDVDDAVLVGHDWGGALAFDWAARHPGRARGVAFFETIVRPMAWEEFPASARPVFEAHRTPGVGEAAVLEQNVFIERSLPAGVSTRLAEGDLDVYREPYPTPESRRPLLAWARAMPLGGEPADVVARVEAYDRWLAQSSGVPKLLLTFDPAPGIMIGPEMERWCRGNIAALEVAALGRAGHHAPEDQPAAIAAAIAAWADRHGLRSEG
jgi:haloalkane dehalogenase